MSREIYEPVIGLEVHIQLLTNSKAFSADPAEFGAMPNTNISVISLGHPGTLPFFNKRVADFALRLGLACKSSITHENIFARKNYFYADLPKGYQITQDKTPICTGGSIRIKTADQTTRDIAITRIHMEEDAGKSMHDQDPYDSLIDLNRAGVPLLEMVSEPEIRNSEEAYAYLTEVRKLVRYLDICDGNMEEGSMRCDANISVRKKGETRFGTKVEVKNMNSIRNVQRAIEFEIDRQIALLESGGTISQETRSFDASQGNTFSLRSKETANDYRYFPEPDLCPLFIKAEDIERVKAAMPPLPEELYQNFVSTFGLSDYDATNLTDSKPVALYFNQLCSLTKNYKAAANWVMGPIKSYLNERALEMEAFPLAPEKIVELIQMIDQGQLNFSVASQKIFPILTENPASSALNIAGEQNLIQNSNSELINEWVQQALLKYPEKVLEYRSGKTGLLGLFMGEVMKLSQGKADPKLANTLVKAALDAR
ncbi:MAG: Asp-tRNA(Asn)/Glu-tRNA(Gln) amidotransferase subunit GatB [Bacteroidia bacterium]|nr:Asp-tRNA(Asn)/Glu-tRNA(Gln) amidotransferase subunit GatB [Bacteroidia bacterium]